MASPLVLARDEPAENWRRSDCRAVVSVNSLMQVTMKLRSRGWPEMSPLRIRPRSRDHRARSRTFTKDKIGRYKLRVGRKEEEQVQRQVPNARTTSPCFDPNSVMLKPLYRLDPPPCKPVFSKNF